MKMSTLFTTVHKSPADPSLLLWSYRSFPHWSALSQCLTPLLKVNEKQGGAKFLSGQREINDTFLRGPHYELLWERN